MEKEFQIQWQDILHVKKNEDGIGSIVKPLLQLCVVIIIIIIIIKYF